MDTFTIKKAFSSDSCAHISTVSNATPYYPVNIRSIYGNLPKGRKLAYPLNVIIEYDDEEKEVVVSEPRFHIHAAASTEIETIAAFKRVLSGYLDVLEEQEETLGQQLQRQLQYLRSIIKSR